MQRAQVEPNKIASSYTANRPDAELISEKQEQEAQLPNLVNQLTVGCSRATCSNRTSCVKANPSIKAENRSKAITQALDLLRLKQAVVCSQ